MNLEPDFEDFVVLLNKHQVEYMVVGGYALAFHGQPRFTGDMDIWIDCSAINAEKMIAVVQDFGAASIGFTKEDFMDGGLIKQIGQPPLRIDILGEIEGVNYQQALKDKQIYKYEGITIAFIGVNDFIKNKEAVGRKKDLKDARKVKKNLIQQKGMMKPGKRKPKS